MQQGPNEGTACCGQDVEEAAWQIQGIEDFNRDSKSDVLWRNTVNGDVGIWQMNGGTITQYLYPQRGVASEWAIKGTLMARSN